VQVFQRETGKSVFFSTWRCRFQKAGAKLLRRAILDMVVDTINQRTGRGIKRIKQCGGVFLHCAFADVN